MVDKVISSYANSPPKNLAEKAEREIPCGPLYPNILDVIDKCDIKPATMKCIDDMAFYGITGDKIRKWLRLAIASDGYINSVWCRLSPNRNCIAACDAYRVEIEEKDWNAEKIETVHMYLKFFISKTGTTVMQVSAHPSIFND
ncbi:hypothetical protein ABVE29_003698 [Providencia stuartii]|uniref:hypothetical protein n=1 Tax=Providencia sp. PROV119 TaxID=2949830 RepID=UPI00234AB959|nr:hypothetical protein [Providencia sp. PROV119]